MIFSPRQARDKHKKNSKKVRTAHLLERRAPRPPRSAGRRARSLPPPAEAAHNTPRVALALTFPVSIARSLPSLSWQTNESVCAFQFKQKPVLKTATCSSAPSQGPSCRPSGQAMHVAPAQKRLLLFQLFLVCLSRACLGKNDTVLV
eukprot:COSAG06_NODE_26463_length_614_cov_1.033010_1_plen_147_part_00